MYVFHRDLEAVEKLGFQYLDLLAKSLHQIFIHDAIRRLADQVHDGNGFGQRGEHDGHAWPQKQEARARRSVSSSSSQRAHS